MRSIRSKRISKRYKKIKGGSLAESGSIKNLRGRKNGNMKPSAPKSNLKRPNNSDNVMANDYAREAQKILSLPHKKQKAIVKKKIKGEKARGLVEKYFKQWKHSAKSKSASKKKNKSKYASKKSTAYKTPGNIERYGRPNHL